MPVPLRDHSNTKIITLHQPYASLIALGLKRYETRSLATNYRGKLAIHAAKQPFVDENGNRLNREYDRFCWFLLFEV